MDTHSLWHGMILEIIPRLNEGIRGWKFAFDRVE
jgi:hypothetical protein